MAANTPMLKEYNPEHDAGAAPSPCISICNMNRQTCWGEGWFRTLDEIVQWGTASESYKKTVWVEITRRRQSIW